jgi:hypothetical protein
MQWMELGRGAAHALPVDRVMVAVLTGPSQEGYSLTLKPSGRTATYPDMAAAKAAAEREARSMAPTPPEPCDA